MTSNRVSVVVLIFVVCCSLIAAGAVVSFRVSGLAASLARVVSFSSVLEADVRSADLAALSTDIIELDRLTQDALIAASDPILSSTLDGAPFVGSHLQAARTIASAAAGMTSAARPLAKVLPRLEPEALVSNGRYDTEALGDLDSAIRSLRERISVSTKQISAIDSDGLDERVAAVVDRLVPTLDDAAALLDQVEPLVAILPIVLGGDERRTWFVGLQNLAEARGTGGIVGAYTVLNIDNGVITMTETGSDADLLPTRVPVTGLPADFKRIWGSEPYDVRSVNVSPHFPYTGQLLANEWEAVKGEDLDGVLAFGQGTVQYMLAATGPITLDGSTVDATNVVKFLSLDVYATYPDAADKNEFVAKLIAEIFTRLQTGQFDLNSLLKASTATPTGDRVQAWSPQEDLQAQIVEAGFGGILSTEYGPTTAVAVNNGGGNKLEQFLDLSVDYSLGECDADNYLRAGSMAISLTNNAPTTGLPEYVAPASFLKEGSPVGTNTELVSVYAPVNSGNYSATVNGEEVSVYRGVENERPLYVFAVDLEPGQSSVLLISWDEPIAGPSVVDVLGARQTVITSPSLNPVTVTTPKAEVCGLHG